MNKIKEEAGKLRAMARKDMERADLMDKLADVFNDPRIDYATTYEAYGDARIIMTVHCREEAMAYLRTLTLLELGITRGGTTKIAPADGSEDRKIGKVYWDHDVSKPCYSSLFAFADTEAGRVRVQVEMNGDPAYLVNHGEPGGEKNWRFREEPHGVRLRWAGIHPHIGILLEDEDEPGACTYEQQLMIEGSWEDEERCPKGDCYSSDTDQTNCSACGQPIEGEG